MTPQKKEKKYRRKKKLGPWYQAGRILIILGAILAIVAAVLSLIYATEDVWQSFTFGMLDVDYLGAIIAIVVAALVLWMIIDLRFVYSVTFIVLAIIFIILGIIIGNIGGLVIIIGAILIIFERVSRE
ncbi:MAG: hypothetical protein FK734_13045 [Asgard group archaeon]|nr:hypothetical protein [Asgard group archaeon]